MSHSVHALSSTALRWVAPHFSNLRSTDPTCKIQALFASECAFSSLLDMLKLLKTNYLHLHFSGLVIKACDCKVIILYHQFPLGVMAFCGYQSPKLLGCHQNYPHASVDLQVIRSHFQSFYLPKCHTSSERFTEDRIKTMTCCSALLSYIRCYVHSTPCALQSTSWQ